MGPQSRAEKRARRNAPQARGDRRRQKLIEAAKTLLCTKRVQEISYTEIASVAKIPLPSCYHFFSSKLELLAAVSEQLAIEYRKATLQKDIGAIGIDGWESIIEVITQRSYDFFARQPAACELWLSGHVPPAIAIRSREREFELAKMLRALFSKHFNLPDIPNADDIFFITHEIGDRIYSLSYMRHGKITKFMFEESKRAKISYLGNYLPAVMPRNDA